MPDNKKFYSSLITAVTLHKKRSWADFKRINLSSGQPKVLTVIKNHQGALQKDLAALCRVEPATMTTLLKNMEREKFIRKKRIISRTGKKAYAVYLTDLGIKKTKAVEEIMDNVEKEAFRGFSEKERSLLISLLDRVSDNLSQKI